MSRHAAQRALTTITAIAIGARAAGGPGSGLRAPRRRHLVGPMAAGAAVLATAMAGPASVAEAGTAPIGYDVSWPNCGKTPPSGTILSIVGVTGGKAFTTNPCLRAEYLAARRRGVVRFYINVNAPKGTIGLSGPAGRCTRTSLSCQAYNYGYKAAAAAWSYAAGQIGAARLATRWWLDVETTNTWSSRTWLNARVVAGALAYLRRPGRANRVGVYSTNYQWRVIAGSYRPHVAVWYATAARTATQAARYCRSPYAFTGSSVRMVQFLPGGIDRDYICP